jgi:hypothetical protein
VSIRRYLFKWKRRRTTVKLLGIIRIIHSRDRLRWRLFQMQHCKPSNGAGMLINDTKKLADRQSKQAILISVSPWEEVNHYLLQGHLSLSLQMA